MLAATAADTHSLALILAPTHNGLQCHTVNATAHTHAAERQVRILVAVSSASAAHPVLRIIDRVVVVAAAAVHCEHKYGHIISWRSWANRCNSTTPTAQATHTHTLTNIS